MRTEGPEVGSWYPDRPTGSGKDNYVFVCGDNWEGLSHVRRTTISSLYVENGACLRSLRLNGQSWTRTVITGCFRALHHSEHHYKHFVRPELLALYSFGPEPSEAVLSLQEINQKRMATAKLNREKLRKMMSQQDEAPLTLGKKRKTDSSSKKVMDERSLPLPPPAPKPSISEPVSAPSVETVVTKDDVSEYDKVNTDVVKVAGVHSLMKGLTEFTVIANRCLQWEEALMKHKVQLSEAAQANQRLTALVNEMTLDRDRVVGEMASLKVEMAVKEDELKKESSEAYDDNNTKYFLAGFSLLKRQGERRSTPTLTLKPSSRLRMTKSVMPVEDVDGGTTSADPQMDDDAAS
uniref:Uncharacterized protein n=1 Tax=Fagus sylvatica TaxID=28930 RepID=A0A2N9J3R0_FAGSY